jgi:hypothetical protein
MLGRILSVGGWLLCVAALAGWFVDAVHRDHLVAMLVVGTGLAALVVVPVMNSRLRR